MSINNAVDPIMYSLPNMISKIGFENASNIIKIGKFAKNIHFDVLIVISFISFLFFSLYNLVIIGRNKTIIPVGIKTKRLAVERATLYIPTSDVLLKNPRRKTSIHFIIKVKISAKKRGKDIFKSSALKLLVFILRSNILKHFFCMK